MENDLERNSACSSQGYSREQAEESVRKTVKDVEPLLVAGLSLLMGMGISIGGCVKSLRDWKMDQNHDDHKDRALEQHSFKNTLPLSLKYIINEK